MSDSQKSDYAGRSDYSGDGGASSYFGGGYTGEGFNGIGATTPATGYDFGGWSSSGGVNTTPTVDDSTSQAYTPISNEVRQAAISNRMAATSKAGEDEYSPSLAERVRDKFTPTPGSYFHTMGVRAPGTSFDEMAANETEKQREARMRSAGNLITNTATSYMPGMGLLNMARTGYAMYDDVANKNLPVTTALGRVAPGLIDNAVNKATGGLYGKVAGASNVLNTIGLTDASIPSVGKAAWASAGFGIPGKNTASINTVSGGQVTAGGGGYNTGGSTGGWSSDAVSVPLEVELLEAPAAKPPTDYTSARVDLGLKDWAQQVRANSQRKRTGG